MKQATFWILRAAAAPLPLALAACYDQPTAGVVIEKRHEPERSWIEPVAKTAGRGIMTAPMTHLDDEDYVIVVEESHQDGSHVRHTLYVTKDAYDKARIGDQYGKTLAKDAKLTDFVTKTGLDS